MLLSDAINRFRCYLEAEDRSPHTVNSYTSDLKLLAAWLPDDPDVADLRLDRLAAFMGSDRVRLKADGRTFA